VEPPGVVEALDVVEDLPARLGPAGEAASELDLEGLEEAFGPGVVPAIALAIHAEDQPGRVDQLAIVAARVLRAAIGVMDEPRRGLAAHRGSLFSGSDSTSSTSRGSSRRSRPARISRRRLGERAPSLAGHTRTLPIAVVQRGW